jgi:hypothetical protein
MIFSQKEFDEYERRRRAKEESDLSFARRLLELLGMWRDCENRACRRMQRCSDARRCATRYADEIFQWKRTVWAPYLRQRFPTVSFGGPADVVEAQIEAALAAERARKATREAGKTHVTSKQTRR